MRVRLTEDHSPYWNYQVVNLRKGQSVNGDLARYLLSTGGPVEAADDEARDVEAQMAAGDSDDLGQRESDVGRPLPGTLGDEPPVNGSADDVLDWVGHDQERAARAIGAETERDEPREDLLERLRQIHQPGSADAYPDGGSAEDIKAWVGEDPERAQTALDAEEQRDKPRSTLTAHLKKLL